MPARWAGVPSGVIAHNLISGIDLDKTILKGQRLRQAVVRLGGAVVTAMMVRASYVTTTLQGYVDILKKAHPKADISLVPHGTLDTTQRDWRPHGSRPRRIVSMGKFGTYKRLETLRAAFDILRQNPAFADKQLVVGGTDHPNTPGHVAGIAQSRQADHGVVFAGYVADEAVPDFFENALISVFDYESTTGSSGVRHQTASYGATPIFPHIDDFIDICRDEGLEGVSFHPGQCRRHGQVHGHGPVKPTSGQIPCARQSQCGPRHAGFRSDRLSYETAWRALIGLDPRAQASGWTHRRSSTSFSPIRAFT